MAFAYACEPDRGSEPTAGWLWARMLARLGEVWVITRANNRPAIERELATIGHVPNLHFVYVDLTAGKRWWKRGQRGVRLYYLLWQRAALREARRLTREQPFDLAWHLTFANAWIGSLACRLGIPFVYGPVGGGVGMTWKLGGTLGARGVVYEIVRGSVRVAGRYVNPLARASWRRASLILVQNEETRQWLPRRHRSRAEVFSNVVFDRAPDSRSTDARGVMLFAGRLLPWKGTSIAISALERLPEWRLIVCGDGPDLGRLQRHARRRRVSDRVEFRGWVSREEVFRTMLDDSTVFVFPSLHDEAGWAVAEAIVTGLPVVCLDVGGPPTIAGNEFAVPPRNPHTTVDAFVKQIAKAAAIGSDRASKRAEAFQLESKLQQLNRLVITRVPGLQASHFLQPPTCS